MEDCEATAFVFFCHNGKKRTTNMMVTALLILSHMEVRMIGDLEDINFRSRETESEIFVIKYSLARFRANMASKSNKAPAKY